MARAAADDGVATTKAERGVAGALARVNLTVTDGADEFSWDAPVWFCDPWPHPFGLAGLEPDNADKHIQPRRPW